MAAVLPTVDECIAEIADIDRELDRVTYGRPVSHDAADRRAETIELLRRWRRRAEYQLEKARAAA
jgi:hypothetical protein